MKSELIKNVIRKSAPELLIGVAACTAVMMLVVDPMHVKLAEANAKVSDLQQAVAKLKTSPGALTDAQSRTNDAQQALNAIGARGTVVLERTEMFRTLMNLAEASGVRVDQFNPTSPRGPRRPANAPAAAAPAAASMASGAPGPGAAMGTNIHNGPPGGTPAAPGASALAAARPNLETRAAYSISLKGDYASIARFVAAIQSDVAFSLVRTIRLAPIGDTDQLQATIETEHVSLDTKAFAAAQAGAQSGTQPGASPTSPGPAFTNVPTAPSRSMP
jgi:Tfp pilus assembly protein PilO